MCFGGRSFGSGEGKIQLMLKELDLQVTVRDNGKWGPSVYLTLIQMFFAPVFAIKWLSPEV